MLYYNQHRFIISATTSLLNILPTKMADRTPAMMDSFGMTNNFISRLSKNNFNN